MVGGMSRFSNSLLALGLLAGLASAANAANCDPNNIWPGGLTLRDLSRNTGGYIGDGPNTYVYFRVCKDTNTITRTTMNQPFRMALVRQGCDEVPELNARLQGTYYSTLRLNDTHKNFDPATDPNARIGYEYVRGNVLDAASGVVLGTFEMNGVIGTNTCRKPMPDAIGDCHDPYHHEGYLTVKFTHEKYINSTLFAEYHFHTGTANDPTFELPWCKIDTDFFGVVDGIYLNRCGPLPTQTAAG